jgi:hypothetical protein
VLCGVCQGQRTVTVATVLIEGVGSVCSVLQIRAS